MSDAAARWSYRPGPWFAVFGPAATLLLPAEQKDRVVELWARIDDGADFGEVLDGLLASGLSRIPAFALVGRTDADDVTRVLVRGQGVRASLVAEEGEVEVDGSGATTWAERSLRGVTSCHLDLGEQPGAEDAEAGGSDGADGADGAHGADEPVDHTIEAGLVRVSSVDRPPRRPVEPAAVPAAPVDEEPVEPLDADSLPVVAPVVDEPLDEQTDEPLDEQPLDAVDDGVDTEPTPVDELVAPDDEREHEPVTADAGPDLGQPTEHMPAPVVWGEPEDAPDTSETPDDAPAAEEPRGSDDDENTDGLETAAFAPTGDPLNDPLGDPLSDPLSDPLTDSQVAEVSGVPDDEPLDDHPDQPAEPWEPSSEPVAPVADDDGWVSPPSGAPAPPSTPEPPLPVGSWASPQGPGRADLPPPPPSGDHDGLTRTGAVDSSEFERQQPGIPGQPPAPAVTRAVARLLISNGDVVEVDRVVLIGRAPEARRFTSTEQPTLVTVPSPLHEISSTHVEVRPGSGADHGSAVVTDMGSTNGTVLAQPGLPPEDLKPGIAVQLIPGAIINLGDGVTIQVARP